ncbi:dihydrolipoamide acetyltransferase family protein [Lapillicoccus jejuensis]|uniref:Dihydrolipoamide acetyltransferase component of pyruvate dehydrogenase complex n=1 Tax=Lapillicoccus jejuensis TaxID=402171 RepID=A0A542DYH8_9MICO|nr:dihydrolipoamide acetyltransferase family protein [Lapillicoccus jejuensis]TQJ08152.1 pyruvate dehydrogenase E2 component (dihydrolipoamide acetyltransferase) [Lapillicoccus jejuensis]
MTVKEFRLPDPGEGLTEAEVVTWHVAVGDTVKVNDVVVEIETAKSLVELPVPFAGTVTALLVPEGETVEVGTPIISIDDGVGGAAPAAPAAPQSQSQVADEPASQRAQEPGMVGSPAPKLEAQADGDAIEEGKIGGTTSTGRTAVLVGYGVKQTEAVRRPRSRPESDSTHSARVTTGAKPAESDSGHSPAPAPNPAAHDNAPSGSTASAGVRALAKPPVRKLAKDLGVDLTQVAATGPHGTVTRDDVHAHASGTTGGAGDGSAADGSSYGAPQAVRPQGERETRTPVKGVRKMTAQAMVGSAFTAPHVTMFNDVDVTATMQLVARLKQDREFADVKVTPMLVLAKALCLALKRHPGMNAVWDEAAQEIVTKHYVNLGIAAATPRGLVVPNVKDADRMTMHELAEAIGALTETARAGRTQPAEMSGGTVTITNVGVFGIDTGTPIINPGESAIVAFGAVRKKPWVVTGPDGEDTLAIRQVSTLAVSFDHRLIDGELGSLFLRDLSALLEDPSRGLVWG